MKWSIFPLLLGMLALLTACSEDKDALQQPTLTGTWSYHGYTTTFYDAAGQVIYSTNIPAAEEARIDDSSFQYYSLPGRTLVHSYNYRRDGDSLRPWVNNNPPFTAYYVAELTAHKLTLKSRRYRFLTPYPSPNGSATFSSDEFGYSR